MRINFSRSFLLACLAGAALSGPASAETLKEAMAQAYEFNPNLKAQRASTEATHEQVPQALSEWRPALQANYAKGKEKIETTGNPSSTSMTTEKSLVLVQPVFDGFGTVYATSSAKNTVRAAWEQLKSVEQETLLQAVTAYMDVVRDQQVVELSRNNEEVLRKQLDATNERFEVGEVTRTDVSQAESRLSTAVSDRVQAEGNLISSQAVYKRVIGGMPGNVQMPKVEVALPETMDELIEKALAANPTLQSRNFLAESADDDVTVAKSDLLPSLNIRGEMSESERGLFLGGREVRNDSVTFNITFPLYQSGAQYSRVRQRLREREQRRHDAAEVHNRVIQAAVQAWENLQTSRATIKATSDAVDAAEVALDGVKQEHQYGARTTLDVLDAEQELFEARVNLVRAQREEIVAVYQMLSILGRLTAKDLGLEVEHYDPQAHYENVKYKVIGW